MENENRTEIQVLKEQFKNIKESLDEIIRKLDGVLKDYVKRDEMQAWHERVNTEMDKRIDGANARITYNSENKLDKLTFDRWIASHDKQVKPFGDLFWKMVGFVAQIIITGALISYFLNK